MSSAALASAPPVTAAGPLAVPGRVESTTCALVTIDGRQYLNFSGSSYLGLGGHATLVAAGIDALRRYGAQTPLARHYGFQLGANLDVEAEARRFFGVDGAMFFGTGYLFGLIALPGLAPLGHAIFLDDHAHYSLRDGARASGLPMYSFQHRDAKDLAEVMARTLAPGERPIIATDGMFATYGSVPPLKVYAELIAKRDGWLVVDESHAFGCLGATGCGAVEAAGLTRERVVAGGSVAKSFGAHGGIAIGDAAVIERLWQGPAARGAALGCAAGAAMTTASLRLVREQAQLLARLHQNARRLKQGLRGMGLSIEGGDGPLATFTHSSASDMQHIQSSLMSSGIVVSYSTYVGAAPAGSLRIAAMADHTEQQIDRLLTTLAPLL